MRRYVFAANLPLDSGTILSWLYWRILFVITPEERRALESELATCRAELRKYQGVVDFWSGAEADDGSNVLVRAEIMIIRQQERIAEIEALLTQLPY